MTVTRPRAQGYGVQIGDEWFRTANSPEVPTNVFTRDSLAQRSDDRSNPEENVLDIGHAFSVSNLTGGEGLDWFPRPVGEQRRELDAIRFWDSADVDISRPDSGLPYTLTLVPATHSLGTFAATPTDMAATATRLYVIVGQDVLRFDDVDDLTPEDTQDLGVDLVQIQAGSDNSVAVLDVAGDVWYKPPSSSDFVRIYDASADAPTLAAKAIWIVKGRVIAYCNDTTTAAAGVMLEIAPIMGGTPAAPTNDGSIHSIIDTFDAVMMDCVDAGHAIVAAFDDGSLRSYVPETDSAGTVPILTIRARTNVPSGEFPYALGWNLGKLLVLTMDAHGADGDHVRLYTALVLDVRFDYIVGQLQLLRTWAGSSETTPNYTKNIVGTRDEMLFWIAEDIDTNNLWRYDLVTDGLFRHRKDELDDVLGLSLFEDRIIWITGDDLLCVHPGDDFKPSGYVITPNITFGLNTKINWTNFVLEVSGLGGGAKVELWRSSDPAAILDPEHVSWVKVNTWVDDSQSGLELATVNVTANTQAMKVVIYASVSAASAPAVARFALRAIPKHRDWIIEVPISISDLIEVPFRTPLIVPGHGNAEHERLLDLQGAATQCTLLDTPTVLRGVVDQILEPVEYKTLRGSQGRYAILRFRGQRITGTEGASPQGFTGLGIGTVGIATVGVDT